MNPLPRPLVRALLGAGLLAAGWPAWSQPAAAAAPATTASAPATAKDETQTIVVTAQKRTQGIKEVPLALSVVSADQLEKQGIRDIADLGKAAAALEFGDQKTGGAGGSASIRGIGTAVFTSSAESSVGVVVDGVPLGNTAGGALFDLERVEVLRGPQGTLFGKSASAGVLNMVTRAPALKTFEGTASIELAGGETRNRLLRGALNVPIGDVSALRVTARADRLQRVYRNVATGRDSDTTGEGVRARYLLRPSSDLSVNLIAEHDTTTNRHAVFFAPAIAYARNTSGNHQPLAEFAACGVQVTLDNNRVCSTAPDRTRIRVQGLSGQVDWTLGNGVSLTSITALRKRRMGPGDVMTIDMSGGYDRVLNIDGAGHMRQLTQELRLASAPRAPLEWVAGLFHADYEADRTNTTVINPAPYLPSPPVPRAITTANSTATQLRSAALFGQATLRLNDQWGVLGGLRYTRDRVADQLRRVQDVRFAGFGAPTDVRTSQADVRETNLSGKLGLQYAIDRGSHAYLTLTRGYKGPQVDNITAANALTRGGSTTGQLVRPEIPTNLEAGVKLTALQRRVDLDLAVFRTRIQDFQEQNCTLTPVGALNCIPLNVPKVTSSGVEMDLRLRPLPGLSLNLGGALILGTEYPDGFVFDNQHVGGQRLLYSPKGKLVLGAEYSTSVWGDYEWLVGGDLTYKTRVRYCNTLAPECSYGDHAVVGLRTGLRSPDDRWGVTLFVRNLTDERVPNAILYPLPGKGAGSGYAHSLAANSFRSIGMTADLRF